MCVASLTLAGDGCPGPFALNVAGCTKPDGNQPVSGSFSASPLPDSPSVNLASCTIKVSVSHSGANVSAGIHEVVNPFGPDGKLSVGTPAPAPAAAPIGTGAIVGIVVGCAFVVIIFAFIISTMLCNGDRAYYHRSAAVAARQNPRQQARVVRGTGYNGGGGQPIIINGQPALVAPVAAAAPPPAALALNSGRPVQHDPTHDAHPDVSLQAPARPLRESKKQKKPSALRDSAIAKMTDDELMRYAIEQSMHEQAASSSSKLNESSKAPPPARKPSEVGHSNIDQELELAIQMSMADNEANEAPAPEKSIRLSKKEKKSTEPTAVVVGATSSRRQRPGSVDATVHAPGESTAVPEAIQPLRESKSLKKSKRQEKEAGDPSADPEEEPAPTEAAATREASQQLKESKSLKKSRRKDKEAEDMVPTTEAPAPPSEASNSQEPSEKPLRKSKRQKTEAETKVGGSDEADSEPADEKERLRKSKKDPKEPKLDVIVQVPEDEPKSNTRSSAKTP